MKRAKRYQMKGIRLIQCVLIVVGLIISFESVIYLALSNDHPIELSSLADDTDQEDSKEFSDWEDDEVILPIVNSFLDESNAWFALHNFALIGLVHYLDSPTPPPDVI